MLTYLPAGSLVERLSGFAVATPDHPALLVAEPDGVVRSRTFAELDAEASDLAGQFTRHGLGPTEVLVVAVRNEAVYLSLILGAWRAGVAVLLISPALDPGSRDRLLELAAEKIARPVLVEYRAHERFDTLVLNGEAPLQYVAAVQPSDAVVPDSELPYLFLTSGGTTGLPKIMEYRMRFAGGRDTPYRTAGLNDDARTPGSATRLICGNLYHTGNFTASLHVLLTGSTVITMARWNATLMCRLLREYDVYSLGLTPAHMMNVLTTPDLDLSELRGLSRVTHGAAPCPAWVKRAWIDLVGPERLFEIYYSTELGGAARPLITSGAEWLRKPGTVGRPAEVKVLDPAGCEVPPGVVGEVFFPEIHGKAHGYVGDRVLRTSEAFPGYVSVADLGWVDEDGYLYLVDRLSEQLQIAGQTVLPGEVEAVLGAHPAVMDVVVAGVGGEDGELRLHALVCLTPGATASADELHALCRGSLAAHQVPAEILFTSSIPRTEEGKLRRSVVRPRTSIT